MMECKSCKHWKPKAYLGECECLASGTKGFEIITNNRDGEWVETIVETLPDWFCKEYEKRN